MTETVLKISKGGLPPFSARGCVQTLSTVQRGETKRTINGELVFLGKMNQEKYKSTLSGKDSAPPALENLNQGDDIQVECLSTLTQHFRGDGTTHTVQLKRDPVPESILVYTTERTEVEHTLNGRNVTFLRCPEGEEDLYISYRPRLSMIVTGLSLETDEWNLSNGWKLYLEER